MTDHRNTSEKLIGATLIPLLDSKNKISFFSSYQSGKDFSLRAASIITAPILLSLGTMSLLVNAGGELLNGFSELLKFDFSDAGKHFLESGKCLLVSPLLIIAAILSPLVNLIDLIGGAINSLRHSAQTPQQENMGMNFQ